MALFTDDFTGADNTLLTGRTGWTASTGFNNTLYLDGTGAVKDNGLDDGLAALNDTSSADHYVETVVGAGFAAGTQEVWATVCMSARNAWLGITYDAGSTVLRIWSNRSGVGGSLASVQTLTGQTIAAGDTLRLEWDATARRLIAKKNGTEIYNAVVTSESSGLTGTSTGIFTNFNTRTARTDIFRSWASDALGAADTTAPTLTSPTATTTGSTTATGSVTTDEANGTLYRLASTNATETAATVIAAALSQTVTATGAQAVSFTGLTASTTYYAHYVHVDAAANESTRVSSASFTTSTPDTTAPTLSSPTATALSNALIAAGVTTNEANGTLYVVATTSATPPSTAQIRAGQDHTGSAAVFADDQVISSTGAKTFNVTGLTQLTPYYLYFHHQDAAANNSTVSSASATTFRNGATAQSVIDNTASVGGNPAGTLYALALTKGVDDWMAYRTISGPTPGTGTLTEYANGNFSFVGPEPAVWVIQPEVNGADDAGGTITVELYDQGPADVTAPVLSTATGTKTGATTATGTVTTNEPGGTLYYLTNTSASATDAAVLAGSTQAVSSSGVQNISRTGLTAATTYYHHYLHKDAAGNDSAVLSSNSFTTDAAADTTAPTLTSPTGVAVGYAAGSGTVSTNESNGTLYWVTTTNASELAATVKAGSSQAVTTTGVQNVVSSGLSASTAYYNHYVHRDAAGNDSTVASSTPAFTTDAAPTPSGSTSTRMSIGIGISLS